MRLHPKNILSLYNQRLEYKFTLPCEYHQKDNSKTNMATSDAKPSSAFKNPELVQDLVAANTEFALDMYKKIGGETSGSNIFFSPVSISTALAMTFMGARQSTADQMGSVLKFDKMKEEDLHPTFADFNSILHGENAAYVLKAANRLFARKGYEFLQEYLNATKTHYRAEAVSMDFAGNADGCRQDINKWVEDQTANKIKDLLPDGTLNALTALVLVNAIYFKGDWANKFKEANTQKGTFQVNADAKETVETDFMFMSEDFKIGMNKDLDCKILELPYVNNNLSFVIMLPNKMNGLSELESKLTVDNLKLSLKEMRKDKVDLSLPKFKLECSFGLNDALKDMGIKDLFEGGVCDLSGMDGSKELFVSSVIHKAFLEVNEEGSEAAAATAVTIMLMCMPITVEFRVDHPFLFMIKDNRSDAILFMGRMVKPPV